MREMDAGSANEVLHVGERKLCSSDATGNNFACTCTATRWNLLPMLEHRKSLLLLFGANRYNAKYYRAKVDTTSVVTVTSPELVSVLVTSLP